MSLPRALVFRDSFFSSVAPFFAGHFHFSRYYWDYWNSGTPMEEMVRSAKPDIVIEEVAERSVKFFQKDLLSKKPDYLKK
jgi:hypothetical protein